MNNKKMKKNKAFTLIELLVVIVILGLLASIIFISTKEIRNKARDARRVSELSQITKALEAYYLEEGQYPDCADKVELDYNWSCMITELKDKGVISMMSKYLLAMVGPPLDTSIQDPLYPDRIYSYMVSTDKQSYRIRAKLEKIDSSLLSNSITGPFLYVNQPTGDTACDKIEGYYCNGIGDSSYDPGG